MKTSHMAIMAGVGALAAVYLIRKGATATVDAATAVITATGRAIDPTSDTNMAYQGANAVGAVLTDSKPGEFSLGSWLWEKLNPDQVAKERAALGQ